MNGKHRALEIQTGRDPAAPRYLHRPVADMTTKLFDGCCRLLRVRHLYVRKPGRWSWTLLGFIEQAAKGSALPAVRLVCPLPAAHIKCLGLFPGEERPIKRERTGPIRRRQFVPGEVADRRRRVGTSRVLRGE